MVSSGQTTDTRWFKSWGWRIPSLRWLNDTESTQVGIDKENRSAHEKEAETCKKDAAELREGALDAFCKLHKTFKSVEAYVNEHEKDSLFKDKATSIHSGLGAFARALYDTNTARTTQKDKKYIDKHYLDMEKSAISMFDYTADEKLDKNLTTLLQQMQTVYLKHRQADKKRTEAWIQSKLAGLEEEEMDNSNMITEEIVDDDLRSLLFPKKPERNFCGRAWDSACSWVTPSKVSTPLRFRGPTLSVKSVDPDSDSVVTEAKKA
ncbi:hypothetical protein L204_106441 [Cryptococcus depauperatus]|nr:hypothetical protein L204_06172 [Cryptococcus depauperatus CBS 7855]